MTHVVLSDKAAAIKATPVTPRFAPSGEAGGWWIATVPSSLEKRAAAEMQAESVETWLPLRSTPVRSAHVRTLVERGKLAQPYRTYPEYPGYVLVRPWIELSAFWRAVRSCRHVRGIIVNAGRPVQVSDDEVAEIAGRMTCRLNVPANQAFAPGDEVTFEVSGLCSFNGLVERRIGKDTLRVLIAMLGGPRSVDVHADRLAKIA